MPSSLVPEVQLIWACLDRSLVGPLMWGVCQSRRFCWPWPAVLTPASGDQLGVGWARTASTDGDGDPPPPVPWEAGSDRLSRPRPGRGQRQPLVRFAEVPVAKEVVWSADSGGCSARWAGKTLEVRGAGTWGHSCHLAHSKASLENKAVCRLRAMRGL